MARKAKIEKNTSTKKKNLAAPTGSLSQILSERKDMEAKDFTPKIAILGVGGAGGNAINNLIAQGIDSNVITISCNTDAQVLKTSKAKVTIQLGPKLTKGHGAGANSKVGKISAQESEEEIKAALEGVHMAFVVAGLGGGTGTGAGAEIARIATDLGILTLGFVTTPFDFEGKHRKTTAYEGLEIFQESSDILIVVGNQNLFSLSNEETTFLNAFALTDEVLCLGVKSVVNTISEAGLINADLADFFTIMKGKKSRARMGTGFAEGKDRGIIAAQEAMASPLLELGGTNAKDVDGVIVCIRSGKDMSLNDLNQAVDYIRQSISEDANIIFGATIDEELEGKVQVSIFATTSQNSKEYSMENEEIKEEFETDQIDLKIDSFEEMIAEDMELGAQHDNMMIHEDSLNCEDSFSIEEPKPGIFKRFLNWFKKKDEKVPGYMK